MSHLSPIRFSGRWAVDAEAARTCAPAAGFEFSFSGSYADAELEGKARWKVRIDNRDSSEIESGERRLCRIAEGLPPGNHRAKVAKMTETEFGSVALTRVVAEHVGELSPVSEAVPAIEFIGDSYTVGFGNTAKSPIDGDAFSTTDATRSYGALVAQEFGAEFELNAFSGRGLVRNYMGIAPRWPIPELYRYTLAGEATLGTSPKWDFSKFRPQVVSLFVGINDWQGEGPHPDPRTFDDAYSRFLDFLREAHPGARFLLLSTDVFPENRLPERIEAVFARENARGNRDLRHLYVETPKNAGLDFHPDTKRHRLIANSLSPELHFFFDKTGQANRI